MSRALRIDVLERLLGGADPPALRDIARVYFQARGYGVRNHDGPHDEGVDFEVEIAPGVVRPAALSVERDWAAKARADAQKLRQRGAARAWFVTSRRAEPGRRAKAHDDIRLSLGVEVDFVDVQDLASVLLEKDRVADACLALGIPLSDLHRTKPHARFSRVTLREQTAYACAFFGADAERLLADVLERAVQAALAEASGSMARSEACRRVSLALGLAHNQLDLVESAVDRLLQRGRLVKHNGTVELWKEERARWLALEQTRAADEQVLLRHVRAELEPYVAHAELEETAAAVVERMGTLAVDQPEQTRGVTALTELQERLRQRAGALDALLQDAGVSARDARSKLLGKLATVGAGSGVARSLFAGELILGLLRLEGTHLFSALGAEEPPRIVLDASVAIPLLCARLYERLDLATFVAAERLSLQLDAYGLRALLPRPYLEEVASHLVAAYRDYAPLMAAPDVDLTVCRNAFVAMYVGLRVSRDHQGSFESFVRSLGLERPAEDSFLRARDAAMGRLEQLFRKYGIDCVECAPTGDRRRGEEGLARAQRDRDVERGHAARAPVTLGHDAAVLAWLGATDAASPAIFCTWDRLLLRAHDHVDATWDAVVPTALADLLALGRSGAEAPELISPLVAARLCGEEALQAGAAVWAQLVEIEKGKLYDADLLAQARAFKEDRQRRHADQAAALSIQREWEAWKEAHLRR